VLDEPTNDLDLETLDLLQEVIADFDGTVLIVSHDRDFLDRTVTITLGLDGSGRVDVIAGGYADWEKKRRRAPAARSPAEARAKNAPKDRAPARAKPSATKLSYRDQRDYELLPQKIEELDKAIARAEQLLSDPDLFGRDPEKFRRVSEALAQARAQRDEAETRWLELAEQVEKLNRR